MRPKCTAGTLSPYVGLRPLLVIFALLAAGCGAPVETQRSASSSTPVGLPTPAPTAVPSLAVPSSPAPPALPVPDALAPSLAPAPVGVAPVGYKGIPTSRTTDGFHVLGAPEAPVTIVDYSDFL